MSLAAIQDNLVKVNLVQQTQTRGDDVARGQEIAQAASQREHDRQEDQVVIHTRETENKNVRADEEREKDQRKKKKREEEEEEERAADENGETTADASASGTPGTRMVMRRINIIV